MEYYLSRMAYAIPVKQGKKKIELESEILQLVKASSKEKATEIVKKTFLGEHPKGTILGIRIMDTLIGE